MHRSVRLAGTVAATVAVLVIGVYLLKPSSNVGPPQATATPAPTASPSPAATASAPPAPSDAACRLLTSTEVAMTTTIADQGTVPVAHGTDANASCTYSTGGFDIVFQSTYVNPGGRALFDAAKGTAGVQAVADIGAEAVYDPASKKMYVIKGDALVTLASGLFVTDSLAAEATLAKLVAGRI